jgi:hypothetical protein
MLEASQLKVDSDNNRYDLDFYNSIERNGNLDEINGNTILLINNLAKRVGAPTYQKTPIFKKKHKHNKKGDISNWNEIRNFKITRLEKKQDDANIIIDKIRSNLNKLTTDSYDTIKMEIIDLINNDVEDKDMLKKVVTCIFDIGKTNFFWSKIYAKLYKDLSDKYNLSDVYHVDINTYTELFKEIKYVDPETDYNEFCVYNKINEERKAFSKFLTFIMIEKLIDYNIIKEIVLELLNKFELYLDNKEKIHELDEVINNILIFATYDKGNLCELKLNNKIESISNMDARKYKGLTQKTVFKCCDFVDEYLN